MAEVGTEGLGCVLAGGGVAAAQPEVAAVSELMAKKAGLEGEPISLSRGERMGSPEQRGGLGRVGSSCRPPDSANGWRVSATPGDGTAIASMGP
jgi:hypothetical protein